MATKVAGHHAAVRGSASHSDQGVSNLGPWRLKLSAHAAANLAAARATATDEQLGVGRACASCNRCPESQALEAPNKV